MFEGLAGLFDSEMSGRDWRLFKSRTRSRGTDRAMGPMRLQAEKEMNASERESEAGTEGSRMLWLHATSPVRVQSWF